MAKKFNSRRNRDSVRPGIGSNDPVWFAKHMLGIQPWRKQEEILKALASHRHVAVRSCNGSGKTFVAALATLWWIATHDQAIAITTAPTERQVKNLLWREIRKIHAQNADLIGGQISQTKLEIDSTRYAFGFATDKLERFQGFHSPNLLIIVDEASGIPEFVFDAISGCMTTANSKLIMIGNPTALAGTFYDAFHKNRHLYKTIHISAFDTPAFTGEIPTDQKLPNGIPSKTWVQRIEMQRGKDSAEYMCRVLGEYPAEANDTLIPLKNIERAVKPDSYLHDTVDNHKSQNVMGLDVARFGDAKTVAVIRNGTNVIHIQTLKKSDLMSTTGNALNIARKHNVDTIFVDQVGIGAGVLDRLKEIDNIKAIGINGGSAPNDKQRFLNLRAEMCDELRQRFENQEINIPDDPELVSQLASITYEFNSKGQLKIESKQQIRNQGRQSPDKADALALAFRTIPDEPMIWILGRKSTRRPLDWY